MACKMASALLLIVTTGAVLLVRILADSKHTDAFWCPHECVCSESAMIVDCSSRDLADVPAISLYTRRLYLDNNHIRKFSLQKACPLLTHLVLSNNNISVVKEDMLNGLTSLKYLILDGNDIAVLPASLLQGVHNLQTLSLGRNKLKDIPHDLLKQARQLTLLNLQDNLLRSVQRGSFQHLTNLHTLNLQYNRLTSTVIREISYCSQLSVLRLSHNQLTSWTLPEEFPPLSSLFLNSNKLSSLSSALLSNCSRLQTVDVSNSSITDVTTQLFSGCHSVRKIVMSRNNIQKLPNGIFASLSSLTELHLEHNKISSISAQTVSGLRGLKKLLLYDNKLSELSRDVLGILKSLNYIQIDLFRCGCHLLPLAIWAQRNRAIKIMCRETGASQVMTNGRLVRVSTMLTRCSKGSTSVPTTTKLKGSNNTPQDKLDSNHQGLPQAVSLPQLVDEIVLIKQQLSHLNWKMSRIDQAMSDTTSFCERMTCVHKGVRMIAGDRWLDDGAMCYCTHDGLVNCDGSKSVT